MDGFLGDELWATNGSPGGTHLVADLCPGRCGGEPRDLTVSGDLLFFVAGNTTSGWESFWLWRSDGTTAGTFPVGDLLGGPVRPLEPFRDGVVFILYDPVRRAFGLWVSNGSPAGTHLIAPLPPERDYGTLCTGRGERPARPCV